MALLFRYFILIFCSLHTFFVIQNIHYTNKKVILLITLYISMCSTILSFSLHDYTTLKFLFLFFSTYLLLIYLSHLKSFFVISLIILCYGFSFGIYILSNIIISFIFFIIYKDSTLIPYSFTYYLTGFIQCVAVFYFLTIKQIKSGIRKIIKSQSLNMVIILSCSVIFLISFFSNYDNAKSITKLYIVFLLLLFSLLLLYYWRRRIKQTYIENLRRLEQIAYENTIADKDKQIKELEENNAYLGRIIHKYRKVIPAMELSVMELLQNHKGLSSEELNQKAESLQAQLESLREERDNLLDNFQKDTIATTQTGLHTIDAMLALMEKRAKSEWIRFKLQIAPSIRVTAANNITEADLLHLLGDLIENAFNSVNTTENKNILIHFGKLTEHLLLEISDSGIPFDIQVYQNYGNNPFTSYENSGGSGTGLMDIWKIKKDYKASLYIYEYESEANVYTKKISFLFDGKNHFLLKTYRDKEIKNTLIRGDLHVFPHNTE